MIVFDLNSKVLLFDLDGTLVDTDSVYINVWSQLLKKYNLKCDKALFDYFIKGKSDNTFVKYINLALTTDELNSLSSEKDRLFIEYLANETNLLFTGKNFYQIGF